MTHQSDLAPSTDTKALIDVLDQKVQRYAVYSQEQYRDIYYSYCLLRYGRISLEIMGAVVFATEVFIVLSSLLQALNGNVQYFYLGLSTGLALTLIFIYVLTNLITKIIKSKLAKRGLNSDENPKLFVEISDTGYKDIFKICEVNSIFKNKILEICKVRGNIITCFDYYQLGIPEYLDIYGDFTPKEVTNANKISLLNTLDN